MPTPLEIAKAKALAIKLKLQLLKLDSSQDRAFVYAIKSEIHNKVKHNKLTVEKLAKTYEIDNKNKVKELTELAIVLLSRDIIEESGLAPRIDYPQLVDLYKSQVNLSMRTSRSMLLQQYSTPAPISYLAGFWVQHFDSKAKYLEPSAGNGLMTIALSYSQCHVNEIDDIRLTNLRQQPFDKITNFDASVFQPELEKKYDGVVTNPPFAKCEKTTIDGYEFFYLDHVMAVYALKYMKNIGKAAIIVGGHTEWNDRGLVQSGKNRTFLHYLYSHYNLVDVISIDGHELYSRQGTAFDTRLILIAGRKPKQEGNPGKKTEKLAKVVDSFRELQERFREALEAKLELAMELAKKYKKDKTSI